MRILRPRGDCLFEEFPRAAAVTHAGHHPGNPRLFDLGKDQQGIRAVGRFRKMFIEKALGLVQKRLPPRLVEPLHASTDIMDRIQRGDAPQAPGARQGLRIRDLPERGAGPGEIPRVVGVLDPLQHRRGRTTGHPIRLRPERRHRRRRGRKGPRGESRRGENTAADVTSADHTVHTASPARNLHPSPRDGGFSRLWDKSLTDGLLGPILVRR